MPTITIRRGFSSDPIRCFFMNENSFLLCVSSSLTLFNPSVWLKDRPTDLIPKLKGVLTNPNCEFYPNFVAIHTLATWCKAPTEGGPRDVEMGESSVILCRNTPPPLKRSQILDIFSLHLHHQAMKSRILATARRKPWIWPSLTGWRSLWARINQEVEPY